MTSPTSGTIEWFLARDGRQHGPLADTEMTKFLELGHLRPGDLVWRAGFPEWRVATDVFDLVGKTVITRPPAQSLAQSPAQSPAETQAPASAATAEVKAAPAAQVATAANVRVTVTSVTTSPATALAGDTGTANPGATAKTGIVDKRPLDTPLLSPAQLTPVPAPVASPVQPATDLAPVEPAAEAGTQQPATSLPVTTLNARLQRAASERAAMSASTDAKAAIAPAPLAQPVPATQPSSATQPSPQATAPAKLQPLPELRVQAPVPLVPLAARPTTAAASPTTPAMVPAMVHGPDVGTAKPKKRRKAPADSSTDATGRGRALGIGMTLAIITLGGGWLAYSARDSIMASMGMATVGMANIGGATQAPSQDASKVATKVAPAPSTAVAAAPKPATTAGRAAPFVTAAKTTEAIDADLKRSAIWQLVGREFPEWYRDRVSELDKMATEKRDPTAVSKHIAEALVSLRRKFSDQALAASPERLRAVAQAFLDNLRQLSAQSTDACYGFISQGETYPAVIDLMRQGDKTEALHKQSIAVFEAVAEGRKAPLTNLPPRKTDYDALAAELTARGWSQVDLQMFSDARALATAPPEQVCKMVQDWFAAQVAIKDPAIQLRLLVESLRPVVAG
jgi:GYF domain 2